jgi:hypothetical protein
VQKVSDASGSKYAGGPAVSSGRPPPAIAKKPVFLPTQLGGGGSSYNPLAGRSRGPAAGGDVDSDGWGADAPEVSRSQLQKVESAYKPTKVNMAELTSQRQAPSRSEAPRSQNTAPEVVRGAYQPVGKVDIAALRAQAREQKDDRPTVVKGAYEPIGKVDIAAIRAKAQVPSGLSPAATGGSNRSNEDEEPRSLADRTAAFKQPERLTSMPKPKVANKFGGASAFTGTRAPAPSAFGAKPVAPAAPVGTASKTFADEGGKTPAQVWAEKKAAQGGAVRAPQSPTSPLPAQNSGSGGGWKSGYTGKSWGAVQTTRTGQSGTSDLTPQNTGEQQEDPSSSPGGVGALKDRFKGAAPMGAPTSRPVSQQAPPPPMDFSNKPNAGARGVALPGLPRRQQHDSDEDEDDVPAVQHQHIPSPPPQPPRSPSPEPSHSPVRIAMPVARGREPEQMLPAEERAPPMPNRSLDNAINHTRDLSPEPQVVAKDPARGAGAAVAAATFGAAAVTGAGFAVAAGAGSGGGGGGEGPRAVIIYDYEKTEDNEVALREGEYVTHIEFVDEDWWMGQNSHGESGLFPSNYVELIQDDGDAGENAGVPAPPPLPRHPAEEEEPASPVGPPAPPRGGVPMASMAPTATAVYDYDAAEDNELSFPEGATITQIVSSTLSRH